MVPQDVEQIRETVREILRVEAPIHVDVLCHKVSKRWGMKSYTARPAAMEPPRGAGPSSWTGSSA